jgi:nucleotide-binding universal stress UspA family protein
MAMQRQILLPLDGSRFAEAIIPSVIPLARAYSSTITLLTVVAPPVVFAPWGTVMALPESQQEVWELEAHDYLAKVARTLMAQDMLVRIKVLTGNPALSVVASVKQMAGEHLLAMTGHYHSGVYRLVKGSVTEQLARLAALPILVLFPHEEMAAPSHPVSYRKLLVLVDGEGSAERALREASHLASRVGAELVQASIAPASGDLASVHAGSASARALTSQRKSTRRTAYPQAQASVLQAPGEVAQTEVVCGQTAEEVFSIIAQQQPDLLVIAAHRQSVVQRLFSGSVAAKVIRGAGIPTLLV